MLTKAIRIGCILRNPRLVKEKLQNLNFGISSGIMKFGLVAFLFLAMGSITATAQNVEVSGTITDAEDGSPLPGVNIILKGTSTGTSSNTDGFYSLRVPSLEDTLIVSFVGYITQEVPINGRSTVDIALPPDVQQLEDVVVVGYGTQEKRQITGSVSSIKEEDFVSGNVNNAAELIQGKVPGLNIATAGGDPNSDPTIRLRGISTFSANQSPLVVVDGIIGASLDNVDPSDIASVDVLKDASASAIYGTRGAAGVIVVTTKKGSVVSGDAAQSFNISYNGYVTVEGVENKLDMLTATEFRELSQATGQSINDLGSSVNYFDEVSQTGYNNVHNLALSGGSQYTRYRISGNFRDRQGIQKGTGFEQINGRLNITQSALDQKLDVTVNLGVTDRESDFGFGEVFRYAATMNPTSPVTADGFENTAGYQEISGFDIFNPVALQNTASNTGQETIFTGALRAEYDFNDLVPGLSASAMYSLETNNNSNRQFYQKTNKWRGGATQQALGAGEAQVYENRAENELFEAVVNYVNDFDELRLESVAGYSYNDFFNEGTSSIGGDFITDAVRTSNLAFAQDFSQGEGTVGSYQNTHKIIGFFGRVNLNWDNTYFANASIRREGSSRFGENEKWGNFWSAGAGVEVTSLIELPMFSQLKLRGSYGVTGQDAPFDGISKLRFAPQGNFFVNGEFVQSFGPVSNANPDLKWEENHEFNVGVDFEALDSRLTGTFEYYQKNTKDLLFEVQVPVPPNLFPTTWENVGELQNKGFEAMLDYAVLQDQDLRWNTGVTFSTFNTELVEFTTGDAVFLSNAGSPGLNSTELVRVQEGSPIGQLWGPEFAEIGPNGEWLFYDANGNMVTGDQLTTADEKVIGNGLPDFSMGWTNQVNYKNFDMSIFIRGVFGHDMANMYRLFYQPPASIATWNVLQSAYDITDLTSPPAFSSFFVEDASYVRLQNASIGYTVPLNNTAQIRNLRMYVSGNNLFTLTGYDGIDPEVNYNDPGPSDNGGVPGGGGGALAPGIERRNNWFTTRTITFGVQLDF